ncbi:MAG: isochorismatase family protein [Chloroflexota bacterium]
MNGTQEPLLAVIDMQKIFAEPDSPWHVPDFNNVIKPIERLLEAFGDRSVFTRFLVPDDPQGSWRDYYREWDFARRPSTLPLLDLAPPWTNAPVRLINKYTFSSWGPDMQRMVGASNTLLLCGVSTECCVLATAIAAADDGVSVRIVADACLSVDPKAHAAALLAACTGFAPMITVSTVNQELEHATSRAGS